MTESRPYRVFLVEDHPIVRNSYTAMIETAPDLIVCGAVASAEEALEQIPEAAPDVVMIDISLPGMDGVQLLQHLRMQRPDLRTLIVSGHDERIYKAAVLNVGANGYLTKDDAPDLLLVALRRVVHGEQYTNETQ